MKSVYRGESFLVHPRTPRAIGTCTPVTFTSLISVTGTHTRRRALRSVAPRRARPRSRRRGARRLETVLKVIAATHLAPPGGRLVGGDGGRVGGQGEVDAGVGHQFGLELGDVSVGRTVETEGRGEGRDHLADEPVKVGVGGALDVEGPAADVVDGLVVEHDGDVGMLEEGVGGQDGVVWLNNGGGDLWGWVDGEAELGLLSVINGKSLEEKGTKTGSGTTTDGVEDEESLETSALIGELSDSVEAEVNNLLTDGVVTTGEVVGGILLTGDKLLWVEELSVGAGSDLIDDGRLEIEEDSAGDVLASTGLREEGVESIITSSNSLIGRHLTIRLDTMFQAVEFPTGITNLAASLANMNGDTLTLEIKNKQNCKTKFQIT